MSAPGKKSLGRPVQQPQGMPTSEQILHVAAKLFMEYGYDAVSMNQVAEKCGVTKATIYYYYPAKTDLFVACMTGTLTIVKKRIQAILDQQGTFQSRLISITENYLKVPKMHVNGMFEQVKRHLTEKQQQMLIDSENELYDTLREGFAAGARSKEIACEDPLLITHLYVSMLRVGERQYGKQVLFSSQREAAETIVAFLWRGIHP